MRTRPLSSLLSAILFLSFLPAGASAHSRHTHARQFVVVLDPGHGADDTGAVDNGLEEKFLTLQVANAAARSLKSFGYKVYLTRTRDASPNMPPRDLNGDGHIDHVDDLDARNLIANRHHADVFISIHFDAANTPSVRGAHGYYCPNRPFQARSHTLANLVTAAVAKAFGAAGYPTPDNGVGSDIADPIPQTRADYPWFLVLGPSARHFVTGTTMPGALIETLFLTSPSDAAALHKSAMIAAAGRGYANGIRAFLEGKARR